MIRSSFFGLEIGRSGLTTAQFGLEVTGHNIANVDTAGFTRQSVRQANLAPHTTLGRFAPTTAAMVGEGTRVQILEQIRSSFLDRRFRTEVTTHSYWNTRAQSLSYVESFFDNANEATSINRNVADFFRSMIVTTQDPVSGVPRTQMRSSAQNLSQMLRMNHEGLVQLQQNENLAVVGKVGEVNRRLENIRQLNTQIYNFEVTGLIANDLRDRRNLELDELSRLIDIDWDEREDRFGQSVFSLTIAGETAVHHDTRMVMSVGWLPNPIPEIRNLQNPEVSADNMVAVPVWASHMPRDPEWGESIGRDISIAQTAPFPLSSAADRSVPRLSDFPTDAAGFEAFQAAMNEYIWSVEAGAVDMRRVTGGEIKAHMDVRDGVGDTPDSRSRGIPYYVDRINDLARALFVEINQQHVQGWTDNPLPVGSRTGIQFFSAQAPDGTQLGRVIFLDADGNDLPDGTTSDDPLVASARFEITPEELQLVTALNFGVSDDVLASEFSVAASSVRIERTGGESGELQRGNNNNLNALYGIFGRTGITIEVGTPPETREIGTFDDFGTTIMIDLGDTLHTALITAENSRLLTLAAGNQRAAIAGVSLDEEMVGLVRFQHAYNGAARVITAIDEALDRLINGTGRVGL